jgi:hypothetical protein
LGADASGRVPSGLDGSEHITAIRLSETISYRTLDRRY